MSNQVTKYDNILFTVVQQTGGVSQFLAAVSSFLRRRTEFFTSSNIDDTDPWEDLLLQIFRKEHDKSLSKEQSTNDGKICEKFIETKPRTNETSDDEIEVGKLIPNAGNGCLLPNYTWTQTLKEIELKIPLDVTQPLRSRDVNVNITKTTLTVGIKGQKAIVDGELFARVQPSESTWMLQDGKLIAITLEKHKKTNWWDRLVLSDPPISLRKIVPVSMRLSDMDAGERAIVEKMLYNQRQRNLGLPTTTTTEMDEEKREILEKFKKTHAELDFSQCKM